MSVRACLILALTVLFGTAVGCSGPDAPPTRPKSNKTTFVPPAAKLPA
jgi:hypothetical protein